MDLLKRSTPTPVATAIVLGGIEMRLETNCVQVISQLLEALHLVPLSISGTPGFVWRIVVEPEEQGELVTASFNPCVFRYQQLSLIHISRQSFLACDQRAGEGIAFLSPSLVFDGSRFRAHFVPALLSLMEQCGGQG